MQRPLQPIELKRAQLVDRGSLNRIEVGDGGRPILHSPSSGPAPNRANLDRTGGWLALPSETQVIGPRGFGSMEPWSSQSSASRQRPA
jgi:hypothetical protein